MCILVIGIQIQLKSNDDNDQDCVANQLRRLFRMLPRQKLTKFLSQLIRLKHKGLADNQEEVSHRQTLDIVWNSGSQEIPIHQVHLAAQSPVFVTLSSEDMKGCEIFS